jgi:Zn-finger nucleic acid-binding protein
MRQYERSGVHVDQCTECRGIFLDRGELEKLIDAETAFHAPAAAAPAPTPAPAPPHYEQRSGYDQRGGYDRGYDSRGYDPHYQHRKKKKSFFEELFD